MGTHGRGGVKHVVLGSVAEKEDRARLEGAGDHRARAGPGAMTPPLPDRPNLRIVLTGGPGGGKTTALDLFRRELGNGVVAVPESATIMPHRRLSRVDNPDARRAAQTAIYHVQRNLEDVQSALHPTRVLLCDRGTVDGAAYWPGSGDDFFRAMRTTHQAELERYDAVFFQSAAVGGLKIEGGNPRPTPRPASRRWRSTRRCAGCGRSTRASSWCPTAPASSRNQHGPGNLAERGGPARRRQSRRVTRAAATPEASLHSGLPERGSRSSTVLPPFCTRVAWISRCCRSSRPGPPRPAPARPARS